MRWPSSAMHFVRAGSATGAARHRRRNLMKVLGRWATAGFAVLTLVLSEVIGRVAVEIVVPASQNFDRYSDGSSLAVGGLVGYSISVATLLLASKRSGSNVLAYLGLDIPRWRRIAVAMAGLAIFIVFTDTLNLALFGTTVGWREQLLHHSAQKDGLLFWLWFVDVVA